LHRVAKVAAAAADEAEADVADLLVPYISDAGMVAADAAGGETTAVWTTTMTTRRVRHRPP